MGSLVLTFEGNGIKVVADAAKGWQSCKDGFGFFGLGFLDCKGDIKAQVSLQVRARPNDRAFLAPSFPSGLSGRGASGNSLRYELSGAVLEVFVGLGEHVGWLDGAKKPGIKWRPDTPIAVSGLVRFYMALIISLTPRGPKAAKDTWENDLLPFLSGQFESNRRRH
jgi:hypothetical protein